ncbi:MAG: 2-nitropropane dioxygenase [Deltaproteobacteria bacterium]|nr:2-nitropropane dioxygenase [Deltaproteobacteria bacterium]
MSAAPAPLVWNPTHAPPAFHPAAVLPLLASVRKPAAVVRDPQTGALGLGLDGQLGFGGPGAAGWPVLGQLPALYPEWLGNRSFGEVHGARFAYVQGAMANGIATTDMVIAMSRAGFLGFFGAAGLHPDQVAAGVTRLQTALGDGDVARGAPTWGCNFIHSPNEPAIEAQVADLYIREGVRRISAAAFMGLTEPLIRYAYTGVFEDADGRVHRRNAVFAKISRPEVARRFLEPPPTAMLDKLVATGQLTAEEARLAARLPVAEDYIVESDSGGHTDNRPLTALFPTIQRLRDEIVTERGYRRPIRLGAAGGIGTPNAAAAAFSLGADFVLTGSVNQACIESGLSPRGRDLLCQAGLADVIMAPAADMFEMGVEVQVLRRGTMFAVRGQRLYELYRSHPSLGSLSAKDRAFVEKLLKQSLEDAWESTRAFWAGRDPAEVEKAERDPKHQMALVFRAYLGQSSKWAIAGVADRAVDYQIWCGPAQGAFNAWVRGTFLEPAQNRTVVQVARNLMEGAAVMTRAHQLRSLGLPVPASAFDFRPRPLA